MKTGMRRSLMVALLPFMFRDQYQPLKAVPAQEILSQEGRLRRQEKVLAAGYGRKPNGNGRPTGIAKARREARRRRRVKA